MNNNPPKYRSMECNRDDALRAKELSEKKLLAKDLVGSKKFALKAQTLFPPLDGISQLISTIDVYLAADSRVCGERDLYAVLGVSPSADDESIKKQYRRLALLLHPDKNRCVGAEGAFQYVNEAFNVLSDRVKRLMYDQKRNIRVAKKQNVATTGAGGSSGTTNGIYGHTKHAESKARARATQTAARVPPRPASRPKTQLRTFWTCCTLCKMQYEYLRIYMNHNLLCPNCKKPFLALETAHPGSSKAPFPATATETANTGPSNMPFPATEAVHTDSSKMPSQSTETAHPGSSTHGDASTAKKFKWGPFDRTAGAASARATAEEAAYAAGKVSQAYGFVKRTREEAQAALKREREEVIKKRSEGSMKKRSSNAAENVNVNTGLGGKNHTQQSSNKRMRTGERVFTNGFGSSGSSQIPGQHLNSSLFRASLLKLDYKGMLLKKGLSYVQRKQDELKMQDMAKVKKKQKLVDEKDAMQVEREKGNAPKADENEEVKSGKNGENDDISDSTAHNQHDKLVSMDVPDPEFHDFDGDRIEKLFKPDQIWATYDDEDGMPRFYSFIQKVISVNPFKIKMAYLSSRTNSEFGDLNWVSHGFAKTCGEFRLGRPELNNTVNMFSHQVKWEKGPKGVVTIFPQKGDIWALYRNWSPDWDENTPDETMYKYDMVEILEEYNEKTGISVAPLVKVHGFKAVFRQDPDLANVKRVPIEEMFRFSHQVPSYRLTADDAGANGPKLIGCLELDPAATPLELLQVTTPEASQEAAMADS